MTPEGRRITAALPAGISGHFGAERRRFVLAQHHRGQVTVGRLLILLRGIDISKRQVMRLLIAGQDGFVVRDLVLHAGLATARRISVDDTGARHAGASGVCTQIGNRDFAWLGTAASSISTTPPARSVIPSCANSRCARGW